VGHRLFLPQKVVWWDVWTRGLQRKHNSRQRSSWRKMKLTNHSNEQMKYTSQPHEILSPKLMTSQRRDVVRGIQPKFVYQSTSPNYYEPMQH